ncbi:BlaI/MecI/CopY family transcriptional regulator [Clostridioides sp. ES-S-0005-03]|uniref:BlaI/MecI/CopY family transcriptional regulator n=1 Tax=unclassified Clostridioides TaxID=2635829 RepID=UPI001D0CAA84|nr:BlaI/MecI/CopY family transcriptional regulator [Clostridioides sp. ES-S-0001-03]MCC0680404.1 BlaI/MecI/CopY family transcriptional regulator [Clostridioides sp. ES-S-0005-03]UDN46627.1 BlaI/MecI/CopY family transcriptional regulator [Clostridioides sp. ES-S-0173-01]
MEQQEVIDKLRRGELILMEYVWRKKSILSKKEIILAMQERYKWRKSTTEILLKRLVKMKVLNKKRTGFKLNYKVLVTKKEYLSARKEERNTSRDNNFFIRIFTTIHKINNVIEEKLKRFIKNMQNIVKR